MPPETITIAKLGAVKIVALAQADVQSRIVDAIRVRKLLKKPLVAVYLVARKSREVVVNGAVQQQGGRVVKDDATLSEVIEAAVPLPTADLSRVVVSHGGVSVFVNYQKFQSGEDHSEHVNPVLQDGDKVYVYSSVQSGGVVRVMGEVKDPTKTANLVQCRNHCRATDSASRRLDRVLPTATRLWWCAARSESPCRSRKSRKAFPEAMFC